jgi:hypothetical protein
VRLSSVQSCPRSSVWPLFQTVVSIHNSTCGLGRYVQLAKEFRFHFNDQVVWSGKASDFYEEDLSAISAGHPTLDFPQSLPAKTRIIPRVILRLIIAILFQFVFL